MPGRLVHATSRVLFVCWAGTRSARWQQNAIVWYNCRLTCLSVLERTNCRFGAHCTAALSCPLQGPRTKVTGSILQLQKDRLIGAALATGQLSSLKGGGRSAAAPNATQPSVQQEGRRNNSSRIQPHYVTLRLRFLSPDPMQLRKMVPLCWSVRILNCTFKNSRMCRSVRTAYGVNGPSRTCARHTQRRTGVALSAPVTKPTMSETPTS